MNASRMTFTFDNLIDASDYEGFGDEVKVTAPKSFVSSNASGELCTGASFDEIGAQAFQAGKAVREAFGEPEVA